MKTSLKRNKDGTVEGITTMGDLIKAEKSTSEREKKKSEYEKQ